MKTIKKIFVLTFCAIFIYSFASNDYVETNGKLFSVGEDFLFEVSYGYMKIGQIRMKITETKQYGTEKIFVAKAFIDSYSWIPFVNLHQIMETHVNKNLYANFFKYTEKENNRTKYTDYIIDYNKSTLNIKQGYYSGEKLVDTIIGLHSKIQDGLSLFYYARGFSGSGRQLTIPCFIIEKFGKTTINFSNKKEWTNTSYYEKPILCNYLNGEANFIGIFGLTGKFEGWFTDDNVSVPVKAKLKVMLGSITIELKKWNKNLWNPK